MPIPESQLNTWSNPGAQDASKRTHETIRSALAAYSWPQSATYDIYLQGSYRNSTNIRGDSDVDLVVELESTFYHDLTSLAESSKAIARQSFRPSNYSWSQFRGHVLDALERYFGQLYVRSGNKAIKLLGSTSRLPADIVVCARYRKYTDAYSWANGMTFWTQNEGRQIINYPKIHYNNGASKNQDTSEWYKPTVRMFKNARNHLERNNRIHEGLAPSYFVECLTFNASNWQFGHSYQSTYASIVDWMINSRLDGLMCQNGQQALFGISPEQWSVNDAKMLAEQLQFLWNNWH